jgi:hypothetical protein
MPLIMAYGSYQMHRCSKAASLVYAISRRNAPCNALLKREMSTKASNPKRCLSVALPVSVSTGLLPAPSPPRVLARLWKQYCDLLNTRPLATKATTAAFIFTCSDLVSQAYTMGRFHNSQKDDADGVEGFQALVKRAIAKVEGLCNDYDWTRALSGGAFGVVGAGYLHVWWGFLEKFAEARFPRGQQRLANTLVKVLIDQGLSAPIYYYIYYIITFAIQKLPIELEERRFSQAALLNGAIGETAVTVTAGVLSDANERALEMIWPTMKQHWQLWPAIHTLNFYFVPLHQRVMVQNMVLSGWSGYLSYLNNGGLRRVETQRQVHSHEHIAQ